MKIQNKQFGEIEFENEAVIKFKEGILGFEELTEFLLVSEKDGFFFWLISIDEPEIIFPLFSIKLLQEEFKAAGEFDPYGIVNLNKDPQNISINLKAPVLIDHQDKVGFQRIIDNDEYPVNYPLFVKH